MTKRKADALLKQLKYEYLDNAGSEGGYKRGFKHFVLQRYLKEPEQFKDNVGAFLEIGCDHQWDVDPSPFEHSQLDLFTIDGVKIDQFISFPDSTTPGGFRKVLQVHANVMHLRDNWLESKRMQDDFIKRCAEKQRAYEIALARANGRLLKPLADIVDRRADVA